MNDQKRALSAAERCHKELTNMLCEARESFEIWKSFAGVEIDVEWINLGWFNPFVSATVDAHYLRVVINLFIIGDVDGKGRGNGHGIYYLRRKLIGAGILKKEQDLEWQRYLDKAKPIHAKVRLVRDKHFAHRDEGYTWQKAMQESGLLYDELDSLISHYYRIADVTAPEIALIFLNEKLVKENMKGSIEDVKTALLLYQPLLESKENENIMSEIHSLNPGMFYDRGT